MISGQVLTPTGWQQPRVGVLIAKNTVKGVRWQPIRSVTFQERHAYHIKTGRIELIGTADQLINIRKSKPNFPLTTVTLRDITNGFAKSKSPSPCLRWYFQNTAFPGQGNNRQDYNQILTHYAMTELGLEEGHIQPLHKIRPFKKFIRTSPTFPGMRIESKRLSQPFKMDAMEALTLSNFAYDKSRRIGKRRGKHTPGRKLSSKSNDLLQAAFCFSGIASYIRNDELRAYIRKPRPFLTSTTEITYTRQTVYEMDVLHPLVRVNGSIAIL